MSKTTRMDWTNAEKPSTPNPPFGTRHPEATGTCACCRKKATHWNRVFGWVCKKHLKVKPIAAL